MLSLPPRLAWLPRCAAMRSHPFPVPSTPSHCNPHFFYPRVGGLGRGHAREPVSRRVSATDTGPTSKCGCDSICLTSERDACLTSCVSQVSEYVKGELYGTPPPSDPAALHYPASLAACFTVGEISVGIARTPPLAWVCSHKNTEA